jgi:uncharacterized phage protein (TIGR02218 family)
MKPVSPELLALLATRRFYAADLYTFQGGNLGANVLRYCGGDRDLAANGYAFPAGGQTGPYFDRKDNKAKGHQKIGVEVDTLVVDVIPGAATLFGAPFLQAVHAGLFDGAEMILDKAFMPSYGDTSRGLVRWFVGRVAEIDAGRSVATFTINSHLELLNLQLPRNLYQPACVNNLGDASCGVTLSSYTTTGTASSGSTNAVIQAAVSGAAGYAAGTFDTGIIAFNSGALNGLSATVQSTNVPTNPTTINLLGYFPSAPASGDSFTLAYGCDKSMGVNGCPKFSNQARYRGFRFVPQPSTAV